MKPSCILHATCFTSNFDPVYPCNLHDLYLQVIWIITPDSLAFAFIPDIKGGGGLAILETDCFSLCCCTERVANPQPRVWDTDVLTMWCTMLLSVLQFSLIIFFYSMILFLGLIIWVRIWFRLSLGPSQYAFWGFMGDVFSYECYVNGLMSSGHTTQQTWVVIKPLWLIYRNIWNIQNLN